MRPEEGGLLSVLCAYDITVQLGIPVHPARGHAVHRSLPGCFVCMSLPGEC
jgi:hypothetical protein